MKYNPNIYNNEINKETQIVKIDGQYIFNNGEIFYGYAIKNNNNLYDIITGKKLFPKPNNSVLNYIKSKGIFIYKKTFIPKQYYPQKIKGVINRYFAIKKNDNTIIEINKKDYEKIKNNNTMTRLYNIYMIKWNFYDQNFNEEYYKKNKYPNYLYKYLNNNS